MDMRLDILKRYQRYDPVTGTFTATRSNREYAALLGIHESYLSKVYDEKAPIPVGWKALIGLARAFPAAGEEIGKTLATPVPEPAEVAP